MKPTLLLLVVMATFPLVRADEPTAPSLKEVVVSTKAHPLTNARAVRITEAGVTFVCDQGMVLVPFGALSPEVAAYYKAKVVVNPTVAVTPPKVQPSKPVVTIILSTPQPKSALQLAQEAQVRANEIESLQAQVTQYEALISRYDRQIVIGNKNAISVETYNLAKAKLDVAKERLAALGQ